MSEECECQDIKLIKAYLRSELGYGGVPTNSFNRRFDEHSTRIKRIEHAIDGNGQEGMKTKIAKMEITLANVEKNVSTIAKETSGFKNKLFDKFTSAAVIVVVYVLAQNWEKLSGLIAK